ncbi:MAG: RNA-protein complex protein Nop10 [Candidatus Methanofastidiosa archaeon]|jgi:H/ACA ribonucleoprotein complex subunit 3|nr:RNA-protein complex protein Nop10 [Candidatus Methanofastidiosa archaeon]
MKMKICPQCNNYTLKDLCPICKVNTVNPHPPKFSPEDRYGKYRRMIKKERGELL